MSALRAAVYVAPPIDVAPRRPGAKPGFWSPIACTLLFKEREAVLVDTPITVEQTKDLVVWIGKTAPGRKLSYIYITYGHGDHWFGIPIIREHFPEARAVATPGTVVHMREELEEPYFSSMWASAFPGQIRLPQVLATPLEEDGKFSLADGTVMEAIECGHSDTHSSTVLWVPDLRLAVCGDVVYGSCHLMLMIANTKEKREEWIRGIEKVRSLQPLYVVPSHKREGEIDGIWHLDATKKYIEDFGAIVESHPKSAEEVEKKMVALYPDRFNIGALKWSVSGLSFSAKLA